MMPAPLVTVSPLSVAVSSTSRVPELVTARLSMVAPSVSVTVLLTWTMPAPVLGATSLSVMVVPLTVTLSSVSVIAGSSTVIAAMSMVALLSMVLSAVTSMVPAPVTRAAVDRGAGERQRRRCRRP